MHMNSRQIGSDSLICSDKFGPNQNVDPIPALEYYKKKSDFFVKFDIETGFTIQKSGRLYR